MNSPSSASTPNLSSSFYSQNTSVASYPSNEENHLQLNHFAISLKKVTVFFENLNPISDDHDLLSSDEIDARKSHAINSNLITNLIDDAEKLMQKMFSKEGVLVKHKKFSANFSQPDLAKNAESLMNEFLKNIDSFQKLNNWNTYYQLSSQSFNEASNHKIKKLIEDKKSSLKSLILNYLNTAYGTSNDNNIQNSNNLELLVRNSNENIELPHASFGDIKNIIINQLLLGNFNDFYRQHFAEIELLKELAVRLTSSIEYSLGQLASNISQRLFSNRSQNFIQSAIILSSAIVSLTLAAINHFSNEKPIYPTVVLLSAAIPIIISLKLCADLIIQKSTNSKIKLLQDNLFDCKNMSKQLNTSITNYLKAFVPFSDI